MTRRSIDDSQNPNLFQAVLQMEQRFRSPAGQIEVQPPAKADAGSRLGPLEQQQLQRAEKYLQLLGSARRRTNPSEQATLRGDSTQRVCDQAEERESADEPAAKRIGRFEVVEKIGQGGFSSVFLALDPHTGRPVALKVPRFASLVSTEARLRFQREARAAAMLSHPAIVPVYEAGSAGPINYIAYEYCPGQTLAQWFHERNHQIDHMLAANIVARLADAVQHAHRRGVVHRDLKPANVLIVQSTDTTEEGGLSGSLRITDFGLCKSTAADEDSITEDGAIIGTPAYMSPEQARSEDRVGPASDIYSLGVILYELLTGQRPFDRGSHLETIRAVESLPPRRPRQIDPSIPRTLEAICLKCLSKEPGLRYSFAHDLSRELNYWQNDLPVMARPSGPLGRFLKSCKRNPLVAASLSFALFALVASLAFATWQWQNAQSLLEDSRGQRNAATWQVTQMEEVIDSLLVELTSAVEQQKTVHPHQRRMLRQILSVEQSRMQQLHGTDAARERIERSQERIVKLLDLLQRSSDRSQDDKDSQLASNGDAGQ